MATTQKEWKSSKEPVYDRGKCYSVNLKYRYSELDCNDTPEERYKLKDVKLIDFWGEGYIEDESMNVITGFREAYNINHQYQLVSNGPNKDRKIPNRIPVKCYDGYNLKPYINDSAAQYVTLMGAPLTDETYREISRILRKKDGIFIFFSSDSEAELLNKKNRANQIFGEKHFFLLDKNVYKKIDRGLEYGHISIPIGFVYMAADKILQYIKSDSAAFSGEELANLLYNFYCYGLTEHWKQAINQLVNNNSDDLLLSLLNVLCRDNKQHECVWKFLNYIEKITNIFFYIQESSRKNITYQYLYEFFKEWNRNIVKVLFDGKYATITNLEFHMPLKLPVAMVDKDDDKPVYGGSQKRGIEVEKKERFWWRIVQVEITKKETIISIFNVKFDMPLKLTKKKADGDGDKPAFGGSKKRGIESNSKKRFYWRLEKVKYYDADFYTLTNVEYDMPLKLPVAMIDKDDDKPAYGGSTKRGIEQNQEQRFYWYIQAVGDYVV